MAIKKFPETLLWKQQYHSGKTLGLYLFLLLHQNFLKLNQGVHWKMYYQTNMEEWTDNTEFSNNNRLNLSAEKINSIQFVHADNQNTLYTQCKQERWLVPFCSMVGWLDCSGEVSKVYLGAMDIKCCRQYHPIEKLDYQTYFKNVIKLHKLKSCQESLGHSSAPF